MGDISVLSKWRNSKLIDPGVLYVWVDGREIRVAEDREI